MIKIKNFFSKYWLFILLTVTATVLGGFYFKSRLVANPINETLLSLTPPQIESYKIPSSANISLDENHLQPSENNLEVYQTSSFFFSDQEAIEIAKKMGFLQPPVVTYDQIRSGNVYTWDEEQKSLSINLHWGTINYHQNSSNQVLSPITLSDGERIAHQFLENNGFLPPNNINLIKRDLSYIKTSDVGSEKVSSPQEANLIEIDFDYEINQRKIINCFTILGVDFSGQVLNFNYQPTFKEVKILNKYPLKTKSEIIEDLKNKREISYLITSSSYSITSEEVKKITSLSFNQINLIYYKYDSLQSYLQPVFLVTGTANLENNQQVEVGLYLPTIQDQYLLK